MRRARAIVGLGCLAIALVGVLAGGAGMAASSRVAAHLSITPITAVFDPANKATDYSVTASNPELGPNRHLLIDWAIELKLVDAAGAKAPGETDPSAGAKVDPTCNNSRLPGGIANGVGGQLLRTWFSDESTFVWYHGDVGSYPGSTYGCKHLLMGPSGHQGVVTVNVFDDVWRCTASINGTNLTLTPVEGPAPRCFNLVRLNLEFDAHAIRRALTEEREALAEIGRQPKDADKKLEESHVLLTGHLPLASHVAPKARADLVLAATLDEHARKEPDTKAGNKQALTDIAEAIKLKKAALPLVDAAITAQPET